MVIEKLGQTLVSRLACVLPGCVATQNPVFPVSGLNEAKPGSGSLGSPK